MAGDKQTKDSGAVPASAPPAPPKLTVEAVTLLKKRKARDKEQIEQASADAAKRKKNRRWEKPRFKRADEFVSEYLAAERDSKRCRTVKYTKGFNKPKSFDLVFAIRTRKGTTLGPQTLETLQRLRLGAMYSGVFLRYNDIVAEMLAVVAPFVVWGTPTLKSIKDLIYKRGYGIVDRKRVALSDNTIVEKALGEVGIICVEDMVHELSTLGMYFRSVTKFLCPFQLSQPKSSRASAVKSPVGDCGNEINNLIELMN